MTTLLKRIRYLRTIDMCHDHYGFYLAWGSVAAVPAIYTIQAQYLSRFPTDLSAPQALAILALGLCGYFVFRSANHEKNMVRQTDGNCKVWGRPAEVMRLPYVTTDGEKHTGLLLCCGWWSVARHANWTGDLMQAFALGACCGFDNFLPWSYTFFISAIFANRLPRDEKRCERKYGDGWRKYCERVRWRLLPGVF